jgi:hypothetical protein
MRAKKGLVRMKEKYIEEKEVSALIIFRIPAPCMSHQGIKAEATAQTPSPSIFQPATSGIVLDPGRTLRLARTCENGQC